MFTVRQRSQSHEKAVARFEAEVSARTDQVESDMESATTTLRVVTDEIANFASLRERLKKLGDE